MHEGLETTGTRPSFFLVQIAQHIIGALPQDLDSSRNQATFDAFLSVFEDALFKSDTMENTKTVSPGLTN